jgi:hypothetical protein
MRFRASGQQCKKKLISGLPVPFARNKVHSILGAAFFGAKSPHARASERLRDSSET